MSNTDDLLANARRRPAPFDHGDFRSPPARKVVVVACMDARVDPYRILGLADGDAHILRNAGGIVTDDVIRSLVISQRLLGTEEIVLMHHTDCGMQRFSDDELRRQIEEETGDEPPWVAGAFADLDADVRESISRIVGSPFVPVKSSVRGFIYDVKTGSLREVPPT